ncbi:MAG: conjugal transfer protein TrbF, partial [Sphingomonadales bacterium]|nr:conjugal transfer protein TrbF [Sphingomonadales bacterium]
WTAILTLTVKPPKNADTLRKNPLGLYVDAVDWSRELDAPAPSHTPSAQPTPTAAPANVPLGSLLDPNLAPSPQENRL